MLGQRIVKHLAAIEILFQQREAIERAESQQQREQQPDLRVQQPAPQGSGRQATNGIAGDKQAQGQRQPQAASRRGAGQRRTALSQLYRRTAGSP